MSQGPVGAGLGLAIVDAIARATAETRLRRIGPRAARVTLTIPGLARRIETTKSRDPLGLGSSNVVFQR
jgi:hypothetical protein